MTGAIDFLELIVAGLLSAGMIVFFFLTLAVAITAVLLLIASALTPEEQPVEKENQNEEPEVKYVVARVVDGRKAGNALPVETRRAIQNPARALTYRRKGGR